MKTPALLVLTDFFQASSQALHYATRLAMPLGARLVLLHVRRDSVLDPEMLTGELSNLSKEAVAMALRSATRELPVPVVAEVGHGRVVSAALDAVSRHHPALVVLGRPDRSELPDELASTTALDLLQQAPYPMLVVPPTVDSPTPPRRLLLAIDGEPFQLGDYAATARLLLEALGAELTVLHCTTEQQLAEDPLALQALLEAGLALPLPASTKFKQVAGYSPAECILAAATPAAYDAVVLLARRRSVLGRLFHRSVTAQVLLHSAVPVLVLPAQ